jgi:hypothetical protein
LRPSPASEAPSAPQEKNKSQNRGAFFTTTQATINSPQSTIDPPQTHQQKTTHKTHNPLENRNLHHRQDLTQKNPASR